MIKRTYKRMSVNGIVINISMAAYDGCHKIYIPVGQEELFIQSMVDNGWIWEEDFYQINSAKDLLEMYLHSCPLKFIQQIDYSGDEGKFTNIIPQHAFYRGDGSFDEAMARKAFIAIA